MTTTQTPHLSSAPGADVASSASTMSSTLDRLLDEEMAFSTVFQGFYSSHLSMSLVALEALGAPPERLEAVFADQIAELSPRRDPRPVETMREALRRDGIDAVVRARVAELVHSPVTMFFHAPIRLAYALDVRHETQVAVALVDWARRQNVLDVPEPTTGDRRLDDVLEMLGPDALRGTGSVRELDAIVRTEEFRAAVDELAVDDRTFDDIASLALRAHVAAGDFFTLHMVTGAHAVRTVAGYLDDGPAATLAARTAQVMVAAYLGVGAPRLPTDADLDRIRASAIPDWDSIGAAAIADGDAHVVKLVYVARSDYHRSGDPVYRWIAARVVGLVT